MNETREAERVAAAINIEPEAPLAVQSDARRGQVLEHPSSPPKISAAFLEHSPDITELLTALVKATLMFDEIEFDRNAQIKSDKANYAYQWASLKEINKTIRKPLAECGLLIMHGARPNSNSALTVRTELWHTSGQWIRNDLPVGIFGSDPREVGKGITYAKRYNVMALLNLSPGDEDDDDGAAGSEAIAQQQRQAPQPAQRMSQQIQQGPVAPPPVEPPKMVLPPEPLGRIIEVKEENGAYGVVLETGYKAGTRDPNLIQALKSFRASNATIELVTRAPNKPGYAPVILEVFIRHRRERESGEEG